MTPYLAAALLLAALLLWPRVGLVARLRRRRVPGERERLEDALKQLEGAERSGTSLSVHDLAGRMGITGDEAAALLARLSAEGLARLAEEGLVLTDEGTRRARRLLRAHRLWERYLADRTNVDPVEWHSQAERMEHTLAGDGADELDARLGRPRYDPHGDPIPGPRGDLPEPTGTPLVRLQEGEVAMVTHLEDEPPEVYRLLVDAGLAVGRRIRLVERGPTGVVVEIPGDRVSLDPSAIDNVTVEPLPPGTEVGPRRPTLADVAIGRTVTVAGLAPGLPGPQRRRLLDLGLVPGTAVTPELSSASGDPIAYRIRGALIALRRVQTGAVEVADDAPTGAN